MQKRKPDFILSSIKPLGDFRQWTKLSSLHFMKSICVCHVEDEEEEGRMGWRHRSWLEGDVSNPGNHYKSLDEGHDNKNRERAKLENIP